MPKLIPDGYTNISLRQLIWQFSGMPKILGCHPNWMPMEDKHNRVHMMAYDALTNLAMFYNVLWCSYYHFQTLGVWGLLNRVSIGSQLRDSVMPVLDKSGSAQCASWRHFRCAYWMRLRRVRLLNRYMDWLKKSNAKHLAHWSRKGHANTRTVLNRLDMQTLMQHKRNVNANANA